MKKIYVCSPYAGATEENTRNARRYCEYVAKTGGAIPLAPHLLFPQFLNDQVPSEREFGCMAGLQLLSECDELWYFGDYVSTGMVTEIIAAKDQNIRVRYVPNDEVENSLNGGKENELF